MKMAKYFLALAIVLTTCFYAGDTSAQCSMCTLNAENSVANGNTEGAGLNTGILYLLAAPYLAVAGIGFLWYKKYRKKNIALDIKEEPFHLN